MAAPKNHSRKHSPLLRRGRARHSSSSSTASHSAVQAINDFILAAAGQPWVLFIVLACCFIDGFFPPIPSESVVVGLAPRAATAGLPHPRAPLGTAAPG